MAASETMPARAAAPASAAVRPPHLLHVFSNFVQTGPELRTVDLIAAFGAELRHSIVAMDGRTSAAGRLPADAPVRLLPSPPRAGSARTVLRLYALLRRERPDLVLTYNWGAFDMVFAARLAGFRRVIHHEEGFSEPGEARLRRRVLARRLALPGIHRVVVPSRQLWQKATGPWNLPAERVVLVPNGVRTDRFRPAAGDPRLRQDLKIPPGAPVVGTVSRLRPVKNLPRLLAALAAVDPALGAHLLIVGDGPDRQAIEERAQADPRLTGRVHFAGEQSDLPRFYQLMDLFALSSDSEQMPVTLLEAMACGLPAVSTAVGDVAEILPAEQRPFLVPVAGEATEADLGRSLEALLADGELRRRLGRLNRRRAEQRYGFDAMCRSYRDLYRSALA